MELAPVPLTPDRPKDGLRCPHCRGPVQPGTPHVLVGRSGVRLYCSAACRQAASAPWAGALPDVSGVDPAPRAGRLGRLFAIGVGIASLSPCGRAVSHMTGQGGRLASAASATAPTPGRLLGPPAKDAPDDQERAHEFLAKLSDDRWIHPLAGPKRRMPIRLSRAFGAARGDGDRPFECRSGHCGVNLGGEQWGEPVFAVHDGVVERVNRDPSHSGGKYVRLAHRDGTIITSYFHLAAIPRWLKKGQRVHLGDIVGLLGETGVYHSGPHLHFALAVKPTPSSPEIYVDPEPLIALWPLKVPEGLGTVSAAAWQPGVPVGPAGRLSGHQQHARHASRQSAGHHHHRSRRHPSESDSGGGDDSAAGSAGSAATADASGADTTARTAASSSPPASEPSHSPSVAGSQRGSSGAASSAPGMTMPAGTGAGAGSRATPMSSPPGGPVTPDR